MEILFEDNHIIAINKACGKLTQGDKTGDPPLTEQVKDYLREKYNKPGNVFIGLPHRLDRPTSGAIIFAKTSKVLPRLNKLFQTKGEVKKIYWAVVDKMPPEKEGTLEHYLVKNHEKNRSFAYTEPVEGGKYAKLNYRYLASSDNYHLLEIDLLTGRHHQIRIQLRQLKLHIKGDLKYGFPRSNKDAGIHLHARKISFVHPVKQTPVTIVANPPKDAVWDYFLKKVQ
ncbi:RNA pseudouridylate synthase, group 1 [hydrothermal vent metagenome]|uniref:RNA pseudouridylate synthase, group 1 n=1 Tax=hydrothermal vent metagenome TaxID=652676 RepID=A0A3B0U1C8_9ZZZZ